MILIRLILVILMASFAFLCGMILCLVRPFSPNINWYVAQIIGRATMFIMGVQFKKEGEQHLLNHAGAVVISNHQNNLDMFCVSKMMAPRTVILGKASIIWIPIFGQYFWLAGNLFINRGSRTKSKQSMSKLTKQIAGDKLNVWIMPEGTRNPSEKLLPFKRGAFVTAIEAGVPIIPVCFSHYNKKMKWNSIKSGSIFAEVLEPISTKGMTIEDSRELATKLHGIMEKRIKELDELAFAN